MHVVRAARTGTHRRCIAERISRCYRHGKLGLVGKLIVQSILWLAAHEVLQMLPMSLRDLEDARTLLERIFVELFGAHELH